MLALTFRYFFIIFCSTYIYIRILNIRFHNNFLYLYIIASNIATTYIITILSPSILQKLFLGFIISYISLLLISSISLISSINLLIISYGLSLASYIIANTFIGIVSYLVYKTPSHVPYENAYLLIGIIQYILIQILLRIEQLRKGILSLTSKQYFTIATLTSSLFIIYIAQVSNYTNIESFAKLYAVIILILASFLLLYYWRNRIKRTYIENMRRLETARYENTIADRDKQIAELKRKNAELGQIVHKYRKTIPAMELSVIDLLQSNTTLSKAEFLDRANALQTQLTEVRNERDNLLDKYQKNTVIATQTGLHTVDALLALMEKRAKQEGIRYKTQIDPTLKELALNSIKESDLLHLLGDLIENAIHAVSLTEDKEILIHLTKLDDCLLLEVSDNGIAFDIQTYQHFGNEPFTSHQSDGGSGTGLMDIWKLKKEYKISLYIYEYSSEHEVYTKKIAFLFDGKNHFLLKTYRDKEIKNALIRGDLHVFSYQTD